MNHTEHPPRIALAFFRWFCHPGLREEIEGDLLERFHYYAEKNTASSAKWFFVKEVVHLFRPSVIGNTHHLIFKLFPGMKKTSILFLQAVLVLIAIIALAMMIRLPLTEGRAANLDLFHIYADPFILYGYFSSIAFFLALYYAFRLLGYVRQNKIFSPNAVQTARGIKHCAILLGVLIVLAGLYILLFHHKDDDPAGFIALCIGITFISVVIAASATVFEKVLVKGIDMQFKNEAPTQPSNS